MFQPVGWEDTLGGVGRPQEIINEDLRTCDYFLMMLWDRWGSRPDSSPTAKFSSGTEEEFNVAKECLNDKRKPMRQVAVLFKAVDTRQMSDPGEELKKVIAFRKELEKGKEVLYLTFDDLDKFKDVLQKYLNRWLMDHEQKKTKITAVAAKFSTELPRPPEEALGLLTPEPASALLSKAQQLADAGSIADAEATFARAIESGTEPQALAAYGNFLLRLGRLSQAQSQFERLLSTTGDSHSKWKVLHIPVWGEFTNERIN